MVVLKEPAAGRAPFAVMAWAAATALAALVAWFGVDSVLIPAAQSPVALRPAGALTSTDTMTLGSAETAVPGVAGSERATGKASARPSTSASGTATSSAGAGAGAGSPSPSASSDLKRYATGGGVVVLAVSANSASLVSATPADGFAVQSWNAPGWLRVDFTEGSTVYSIYATWNGTSPEVQVVGPSGN